MTNSTKKKKLTLQVPQILCDRLNEETGFLGIYCKAVEIEGQRIESRTELLRFIITTYIQRCLNQGIPEIVEVEGDRGSLPFYLDKNSRGLWETAIRAGVGNSYNQIAEMALYDYFLQPGNGLESLADEFEFYARKYRGEQG
jgi:hypothetical protein